MSYSESCPLWDPDVTVASDQSQAVWTSAECIIRGVQFLADTSCPQDGPVPSEAPSSSTFTFDSGKMLWENTNIFRN